MFVALTLTLVDYHSQNPLGKMPGLGITHLVIEVVPSTVQISVQTLVGFVVTDSSYRVTIPRGRWGYNSASYLRLELRGDHVNLHGFF